MKGILRRLRPSPAMVVACTALLFAMTGAGYAAGMLGPNTVGTKQLKKNAVISSKVKNRSLLAVDFKAGQLPKGAKGDPGAPGAPGQQGPPGTPADTTKLGRVAQGTGSAGAPCPTGGLASIAQTTLTVPGSVNQFVRVSGTVTMGGGGAAAANMIGYLYQDAVSGQQTYDRSRGTGDQFTWTNEWVFAAAPGTHTYQLRINCDAVAPAIQYFLPRIVAEMIPLSGSGAAPAVPSRPGMA